MPLVAGYMIKGDWVGFFFLIECTSQSHLLQWFSRTLFPQLGGYLSLCNILNGLGTIGALYIFYSSLGDYTLLVAANNAALVAHAWLAMPFLTDALVFLSKYASQSADTLRWILIIHRSHRKPRVFIKKQIEQS